MAKKVTKKVATKKKKKKSSRSKFGVQGPKVLVMGLDAERGIEVNADMSDETKEELGSFLSDLHDYAHFMMFKYDRSAKEVYRGMQAFSESMLDNDGEGCDHED